MWTLVVITTFFVRGTGQNADIYSFSPVVSQAECQVLKGWVDKLETGQSENKVTTFCVPISK
jgi:hypothetical protein